MNVKLLFFPLAITFSLAMAVFYTKPEFDTAMSDRKALSKKETFVTTVKQKIQNVRDLENNLNANKDNENTVLRYLPSTRDDDRIVDGVNFLASQSGLALTSVKIEKPPVELQPAAPTTIDAEAAMGSDVLFAKKADIAAVDQTPIIPIVPKVLSVTVAGMGSYESIRDVIIKLSHTDRFQDFAAVNIDRVKSGATVVNNQSTGSSNVLSALFTMNFTYFPKVNARGNFNRPILAQNKFDFSVVQKLKQYTSTPVPAIEVGSTGSANPFTK
jgi:hypothetical protein